MENKYIPMRKCICCQTRFPKNELMRIAKTDSGYAPDPKSKLTGRGAYICKKDECIFALEKKNALSRAFKEKVSKESYEKLTEELKNI